MRRAIHFSELRFDSIGRQIPNDFAVDPSRARHVGDQLSVRTIETECNLALSVIPKPDPEGIRAGPRKRVFLVVFRSAVFCFRSMNLSQIENRLRAAARKLGFSHFEEIGLNPEYRNRLK